MSLQRYREKRDFGKTSEPRGGKAHRSPRSLRFVVQKHAARTLHYDFRLELSGVLKSWAVPKGPSVDPGDKRLAVEVEDHPLEYGDFEGVIPEHEYGAGTVEIWDRGTWTPDGDGERALREGHLAFTLSGKRLRGRWVLIRIRRRDRSGKQPWLLIKERDARSRQADSAETKRGTPAPKEKQGRRREPGAKPTVAGVAITHPDRVVYPEANVTKLAVAEYYANVADRLLPFVADRALSIVRCPEGAGAECFYQKHLGRYRIPGVDAATIEERSGRNAYIVANTVEALVGLAQANALELHAWGATVKSLDRPDTLVIDLDPDRELPWRAVVEAARDARALLEGVDVLSFVKTTGGNGLHVVVPLERRHSWDRLKEFARSLARNLEQRAPERFTSTAGETHRRGKIFVDYLRNTRGATAVVPYSLRARPGATVATPLSWDELSERTPPSSFTIATVPKRIARGKDPWAEYDQRRQRLPAKGF